MLGRDVVEALAGRDVVALTRDALDITDARAVADAVAGSDVVVNCAAWTAVDDAEAQEDAAYAVNATGAANLASACDAAGAWLVQVSTDYVFDGDAKSPVAEAAELAPRTAYGRTKADGERAVRLLLPDAHYVLRTAWLYGEHGPSFVRTMARLESERDTVDVVDDQRGQPTWSMDVAHRIAAMVDAQAPAGAYHATSSGDTTWFGLAQRVFALLGADPSRVRPVSSDAYPRPARRPAYSVLGHEAWGAAGLAPLRQWSEALDAAWPVLAPGGVS